MKHCPEIILGVTSFLNPICDDASASLACTRSCHTICTSARVLIPFPDYTAVRLGSATSKLSELYLVSLEWYSVILVALFNGPCLLQ